MAAAALLILIPPVAAPMLVAMAVDLHSHPLVGVARSLLRLMVLVVEKATQSQGPLGLETCASAAERAGTGRRTAQPWHAAVAAMAGGRNGAALRRRLVSPVVAQAGEGLVSSAVQPTTGPATAPTLQEAEVVVGPSTTIPLGGMAAVRLAEVEVDVGTASSAVKMVTGPETAPEVEGRAVALVGAEVVWLVASAAMMVEGVGVGVVTSVGQWITGATSARMRRERGCIAVATVLFRQQQ